MPVNRSYFSHTKAEHSIPTTLQEGICLFRYPYQYPALCGAVQFLIPRKRSPNSHACYNDTWCCETNKSYRENLCLYHFYGTTYFKNLILQHCSQSCKMKKFHLVTTFKGLQQKQWSLAGYQLAVATRSSHFPAFCVSFFSFFAWRSTDCHLSCCVF